MRFLRIEVENFRAIRRAVVDFGPGLNVLFGPNDLGKTTLASAMRAALLLPAESSAHQAFVPWQTKAAPRIVLGFEALGSFWRIDKTFGSGSVASARLECSPDGSSYHEEVRGRAVERRVRELLGWGIEAPGGKSGARGLPESFLSHVLLGGQADASQLLERSLGADRDESGRQRLHQALQSLAQDPVFKRVLDTAQAKVDSAFTPTGRKRLGQTSPFASLRDQIAQLGADFERFAHQRRESEEVQNRVEQLAGDRLAAEESISALERAITEHRAALLARDARQVVRQRHHVALKKHEHELAKHGELLQLEADVAAAKHDADESVRLAAASLEALGVTEVELTRAENLLTELAGDEARARRAVRRLELESRRAALSAELMQLEEVIQLRCDLKAARELEDQERKLLNEAERGVAQLQEKSAALEVNEIGDRRLEAFCRAREAESVVERALGARADASKLQKLAKEALLQAEAALSRSREIERVSGSVLSELRGLEAERRVAAARLDVGLTLRLDLREVGRTELALDDGHRAALDGVKGSRVISAQRRISLRLEDVAELEILAGDPDLQREFERLDRVWAERAWPLLERARVDSIEQLAERSERRKAFERQAEEAKQRAAELERQAAEKQVLGADLERARERAERLAGLFDASHSAALARAALELGVAWEKTLGERLALMQKERVRLNMALDGDAVRAAGSSARLESAERAVWVTRERFEQKLGALSGGGDDLDRPGVIEERASRVRKEVFAVSTELGRLDQGAESEAARVRSQRDAALERATRARGERTRRDAASLALRDRHLELAAQLRERKLHFDACALETARAELSQREAELGRLAPENDVTVEQLEHEELELERARAHERQRTGELRRAEGALGQIGGDVAAEREKRAKEALGRARELEMDLERDYEGYRLLVETLRTVENEQGVHLGRALERPVSERFDRLTRGRYGSVELDAELGLRGVMVAGEHRGYRELSEGTQEQLATIVRLCIAEHLETALVLDDHLAQTHRQRAEWFRAALRDAGERIQIVVLTARPEDLLRDEELAVAAQTGEAVRERVRAVDLERRLDRATY